MMTRKNAFSLSLSIGGCLAAFGLIAQQTATEAPAGFDTPTLSVAQNPGSQSTGNGNTEPSGDTFAVDQALFERREDASLGLGPLFNATSCSDCHQNPVTGGASQITEIRVGHLDSTGAFVNPTVAINDGANSVTGRSLINDRAICDQVQQTVPDSENIRALRAVLNTLGDGFVEAVDDQTLLDLAAAQPGMSNGQIHGEAIQVPILEAPAGTTRVGRFGWKDQHGSVLSFAADAYVNEMGVTSRLKPKDFTDVCKTTTDPEDIIDNLGMGAIDHFAQFIRGTKTPPRDTNLAATSDAQAGQALFEKVGCNICHVESLTTVPPGTQLNGGTITVSDALGNKIIHPFGDFLLHDVGTGDGIYQAGPADTAAKMRTVPLWGLRMKARYMHDLKSMSLQDAIHRHAGEAKHVERRFAALTQSEQQQVLTFLKSL
ncbi:MAG TPA: di-heme oxidoredictase family protein [Bryobacteraceae bacterium]|nr:di-heme oxidoredictase family protein [Bryobacteraceae bacterium]